MAIEVKYFASLRELMGREGDTLPLSGLETVADVWQKVADQPMPPNTLMAVNMEYVDAEHGVKDGDEVAFFPPVTGG